MKIRYLFSVGCSLLVTLPVMAQLQAGSTPTPVQNQAGNSQYSQPVNTGNPYGGTLGFYNPTVGNINYPGFGVPRCVGGNFYNILSGNCNLPMWRAPSGYYYPWAPRPGGFVYNYPMPILMLDRSSETPAPALPPLSVSFSDLEKYLEEAKKDGKISERDYNNISRRVKDLKSKERNLRIAASGSLDPGDETQLRRELDQVGSDLTWRVTR